MYTSGIGHDRVFQKTIQQLAGEPRAAPADEDAIRLQVGNLRLQATERDGRCQHPHELPLGAADGGLCTLYEIRGNAPFLHALLELATQLLADVEARRDGLVDLIAAEIDRAGTADGSPKRNPGPSTGGTHQPAEPEREGVPS